MSFSFDSSTPSTRRSRSARRRRGPGSVRWKLPKACTHLNVANWRAIVRFESHVLTFEDCCYDCIPKVIRKWKESGSVNIIQIRRDSDG